MCAEETCDDSQPRGACCLEFSCIDSLTSPDGRATRSLSITMRTPGDDEALAVGFLFSESIISKAGDIASVEACGPPAPDSGNHNVVRVDLAADVEVDLGRLQRHFYTTSSCGVCGKASLDALHAATESWGARIEFVEESDEELAEVIRERHTDRVRYASRDRVPKTVLEAIGETGIYIAAAPVLAEGRIELLWYLREQSISFDYHRYGTLGDRALEERAPTE